MLKGAIQKTENRVRITTSLLNANSGNQLWEDQYDGKLEKIFILQDEITTAIMRVLEVQLIEGEQASFRLKGSSNINAYMKFLKALGYFRAHNRENNIKARQEVEEAINLSPEYAEAYVLLAMTYVFDLWYGIKNPIISLAQASKFIKKAILLNPNGADAYIALAFALYHSDRPAEAFDMSQKAFALNPLPPSQYYHILGHIYLAMEQYEKALVSYKKASELEPNNIFAHIGIANTCSLLGLMKESRTAVKNVLKINPNFSIDDIEKSPNKNKNLIKRTADALRKAGLPE